MIHYPASLVALSLLKGKSLTHWFRSLGGLGLIPLGWLDASVIPLPGSMDILTVVLAAHQPDWWAYFALMATIGSVSGNYATYRLARKGGKEALERRLSKKSMKRVTGIFERWGFGAIAVPALLPPPVPMVPFVLAAGAMQYSLKKFLLAMTLGRAIRYVALSLLAAHYGHTLISFINHQAHPVALTIIGLALALVGAVVFFYFSRRHTPKRRAAKAASAD
jgi:membrane protein YqaA with SNARE-associated domain